MSSLDVIAYVHDSCIMHPQCAIERYVTHNTVDPDNYYVDKYGYLYGHNQRGEEMGAIFAYEKHNVQNDVCDACMQPIVDD